MNNLIKEELKKKYRNATDKLILLDYDGTLVDFAPLPEKAIPTEKLLDVLAKLIAKPQTKVMIISGRGYQDIDRLLGHLPINIIAEHGAMMKENGVWKKQIIDNGSWKNKILPILNRMTLTCPNSFIEEKHFSLTWHYRNAESESGYSHSRALIYILETTINEYSLKMLDGNKVVEIMTKELSKGIAVKNLVEQNKYDYILAIGDDKTDEEMFEYLSHNANADSVKVGEGNTLAKYKLDNVNKVISLLEQLSQ
ncbi:MAG: trehalose-phosphatase [Bacteroidetes bacterium]|nr:trehalose-phosphatase [Bacteroidota bacterium]